MTASKQTETIPFKITDFSGERSEEDIRALNAKKVSKIGHSRYQNRQRIEDIQEQIRIKHENSIEYYG